MPKRAKISALKSPFYSNAVGGVTFTINAETANTITVNAQLTDVNGDNLTQRATVNWFLTTDAVGLTTGAAVSAGVVSGANGKVNQTTAGVAGFATSDATGRIDFVVGDAGALTRYLVIVMPDGTRVVSGAIALV